ncbi:MAG: diadenylate cyclase CdaA [Patescibacteria group bacterium]
MAEVYSQLAAFLQPFNVLTRPTEIVDLLIVAGLAYLAYRFIEHTRAVRIIYGIVILVIIWALGRALDLTVLNTIMRWLLTSIVVAIPVVFQPELRAALEKVGRTTRFVTDFRNLSRKELDYVIEELTAAIKQLVRQKLGAIIVISRGVGLQEYLESGERLDGKLSAKLLTALFQLKSPLHDGAVVLEGNKILAAGVTLPLAPEKLEQGTRHRAALGISQETDAIVIVVSEEDQSIELAYEGALIPVESAKELTRLLTQLIKRKG